MHGGAPPAQETVLLTGGPFPPRVAGRFGWPSWLLAAAVAVCGRLGVVAFCAGAVRLPNRVFWAEEALTMSCMGWVIKQQDAEVEICL